MKITTNAIGNYNPYKIKNVKANVPSNKVNQVKANTKITNAEKDFFTKLYPNSKEEIVDYHFYQRTGKMNGVSVGSLFDRRG